MAFRERIARLSQELKTSANHSLRALAKKIGFSKSSVHRHKIRRQARINSIGHDFFETELGAQWLERLYYAVILIVGIQGGVGSETIALFFEKILVSQYVAISPSVIRKIKREMRVNVDTYGGINLIEILKRCRDKIAL